MATPSIAANAYAALAKLTDPSAGLAEGAPAAAGGQSFGAMLKEAIGCASTRPAHKSDTQTQALAAGKANMVDVVTAVSETEVAIEALVSVRDKVIQPTKTS